ncbi:MAG: hypothetical protein KAS95_01095 [Candidatus Heimdallarchaeota archaeon]|nr:hypothetical protein [Candidatus Heimdallarchaeota archaeon]
MKNIRKMSKMSKMSIALVLGILSAAIYGSAELVQSWPPYYGSVDFDGTVDVEGLDRPVENVKVELLEDGNVKRGDYTDSNGYYEFTWTVERFKIYSIRIYELGFNQQDQNVLPQSSSHTQNFELDGRVALFLWASDVANQSIMEELADQLKTNESFTDFLYYEDEEDWEDSIDALDAIETYDSQVFIYIIGHGVSFETMDIETKIWENVSRVYNCGLNNTDTYIYSNYFVEKLQDLDSQNIFLLVDSCESGDFIEEWEKPAFKNEHIFTMSSSLYTKCARWYGDNGTNFNVSDQEQGVYGGAFTHFFFERLSQGYTDIQSFNYAYVNTNAYAFAFMNQSINQQPQKEDLLDYTWF